jgi:hypothetical protein
MAYRYTASITVNDIGLITYPSWPLCPMRYVRLAKSSALRLRSQPMRVSTGDAYRISVVRGVVIYSLCRLKNPNMK